MSGWEPEPTQGGAGEYPGAEPEMAALLDARDYTGAITLIEFERKMFMDKKQASGWRAGVGGEYEWVEGGSASLTAEEAKQDSPYENGKLRDEGAEGPMEDRRRSVLVW